MHRTVSFVSGLSIMLSILSVPTWAGVTITGTRIIFPSSQNTVTVQLNNKEAKPALIQAWLDNGNPREIPEANQIPFILTPPLVQIPAKKGQMIRLIAKDTSSLAKDRESLYWFNILDIPSTEQISDEEKNKLQVSIRSRIKLFYRPNNLKMTQNQAFNSVQFNYNASNKSVSVNNPSPYYLSFNSIIFNPGKENYIYDEALMVAPYSTETFQPKIKFKPTQLTYLLINDYGANQSYQIKINGKE